jgi:hypothetical protein
MNHIQEMLRRKELELAQIQKEVEALRVVASLFAERNGRPAVEAATPNDVARQVPAATAYQQPMTAAISASASSFSSSSQSATVHKPLPQPDVAMIEAPVAHAPHSPSNGAAKRFP